MEDDEETLTQSHRGMSGHYDGAELRPYNGRPGAMDAFAMPSRMGGRLYYRDGRVEAVGDSQEGGAC